MAVHCTRAMLTQEQCALAIDDFYNDIVNALSKTSDLCIQMHKTDFYKFWWDSELDLLKDNALKSFNSWKAIGKPRLGKYFDMTEDKLQCSL